MKPGWKIRGSTSGLSVALLLLQAALVNAVALTGCASDNTGSGGTTNIYMSNGKCHDLCNGYAFAITQYQHCYCSNEAPANQVNVGECNTNCPGYPSEKCGGNGLYGYVALGPKPSGTAGSFGGGGGSNNGGGGGSSSQEPPPPSSTPAPEPSTVFNTIVSTQVNTFTPSSSDPETVLVTTTASTQPSTAVVPVPIPESTTEATPSASPTTYTERASTQRITVSGQVVTSVITSTPSETSTPAALVTSAPDTNAPQETGSHLSNGAVAGITIGSILAAALIGLVAFFCWRQRRRSRDQTESGLNRNSSVLSKTGLLGRGASNRRNEAVAGVATLPKINTSGIMPGGAEPTSAHTDATQMSEARRSSKPIFVDSRLNPNAIMWQGNDSRTSIGTLQDNQDYSRPLEVRNPDQ